MKKVFYFAIVVIAFSMCVTSCQKSATSIDSTDSTYVSVDTLSVDTLSVDSIQSTDSIL